MLDYDKIDKEYDRIHRRLDQLEERYETTPPQRKIAQPINVADGMPLHIRCFLIYRTTRLPNLKIDCLNDANKMAVVVTYYDPYELPIVPRRIIIEWAELKTLWEADKKQPRTGVANEELPRLVESYLQSQGYLTPLLSTVPPNDSH